MQPSFAHEMFEKRLEKQTYTQSYPHYPQNLMWIYGEKMKKNRKNVLFKMTKKNFCKKRIDKINVE